jgi:putative aldouronate transport system permease protein
MERVARRRGGRYEIGFQVAVDAFLALVLFLVAVPLLRVIVTSVAPLSAEGVPGFGFLFTPWRWTFEAYRQLLGHRSFLNAAYISVVVTVGGTALNLALTMLLAYALSVRSLPGRPFFSFLILVPFLFNPGLIPTYLVVTRLGLIDRLWAIILPTAVNITNTFIMRNFFAELPEELKEAARMDGAGDWHILLRIIPPLARPIILTIGLYYAVGHWNEFFAPILYLNNARLQPLPVLLRNILLAANLNEYVEYDAYSAAPVQALKAASVLITTLPMALIYPWIQRYFTKGTLAGGIKG